jgi:hypothetical protein
MRRTSALAVVVALLVGCARGGDSAGAASDTQTVAGELGDTAQTTPAAQPSGQTAAPDPRVYKPTEGEPISVSDLDAYVRGVRAEIDSIQRARARLRDAKSQMDSLNVIAAAVPHNTQPHGAARAGLSLDRYRAVVDRVEGVLAARDMSAAWATQKAQMDTMDLPAEIRAQARANMAQAESAWSDPYKGLAPEVTEAIKRRSAELDTLRARLLRARLVAAGGT